MQAQEEETERLKGHHRYDTASILIFLLIAGILTAFMLRSPFPVMSLDSAVYAMMGKSIAEGLGLSWLALPEGVQAGIYGVHTFFVSLMPFIVGLLLQTTGMTDIVSGQKVIHAALSGCFLLSIPFFYSWVRQNAGRASAIWLTLLLVFNPLMYKYTQNILPDMPYWWLSIMALFAGNLFRLTSGEGKTTRSWVWFGLMLLVISLSMGFREIGASLAAACLVWLLIDRLWKHAAIAALVLGFAFWLGSQLTLPLQASAQKATLPLVTPLADKNAFYPRMTGHSRTSAFLAYPPIYENEVAMQAWQTNPPAVVSPGALPTPTSQPAAWQGLDLAQRYTHMILDMLFPPLKLQQKGDSYPLFHATSYQMLFWLVLGWGLRLFWRRDRLATLYLMFYALGVLLVPYPNPRLLAPWLPLAMVPLSLTLVNMRASFGMLFKSGKANTGFWRFGTTILQPAVTMLVPVLYFLAISAHVVPALQWVNHGRPIQTKKQRVTQKAIRQKGAELRYFQTLRWLKRNTPANSVIVTPKPPVIYLYASRQGVAFPLEPDPAKMLSQLDAAIAPVRKANQPVLVMEDAAYRETQAYLSPLIQQHPERFELIYQEHRLDKRDKTPRARIWQFK